MNTTRVYLVDDGKEVLPYLYLSDVVGFYGVPGIYNVSGGEVEFEYKGLRVRRFDLKKKYGRTRE